MYKAAARLTHGTLRTRIRCSAMIGVIVRLLVMANPTVLGAQVLKPARLVADSGGFHFDGKPLQIISGEMHYARIPRAYWRDRLKMARAMGLNTISTYVFWNLHEPKPGVFDFKGQNDVAEFVREAGRFRPGMMRPSMNQEDRLRSTQPFAI